MKLSASSPQDKGFALPIAAGLGAIMVLIAITMVIRSNQSQVASISQKSSNQSLAAAETGVSQYLNFFNRHRNLANTSCGDVDNDGDCDGWNTRIVDFTTGYSPNVGCDDPNTSDADLVARQIINVSSSDPSLGSFQLLNYRYDPTNNRGTMEVLGNSGGVTQGSTKLNVEFPVLVGEPPLSAPSANLSGPENLFSQCQFPLFNGASLETSVASALSNEVRLSPIENNQTLPRSVDPDFTTYILDQVNGNNFSLDLQASEELFIENGKTVFLVTDKDINVNEGVIRLGTNSRLFIISSANITLNQGGNTVRPIIFTPSISSSTWPFQVFLTGEDADSSTPGNPSGEFQMTVSPGGGFPNIPLAAYAPRGTVTVNSLSGATVRGNVWARKFVMNPPGQFVEQDVLGAYRTFPASFPVFWQERLNIPVVSKTISPITSWKKQVSP